MAATFYAILATSFCKICDFAPFPDKKYKIYTFGTGIWQVWVFGSLQCSTAVTANTAAAVAGTGIWQFRGGICIVMC